MIKKNHVIYSRDLKLVALKQFYLKGYKNEEVCHNLDICRKTLFNWREKYKDITFTENTTTNELLYIDNQSKENRKPFTELSNKIGDYITNYIVNNSKFKASNLINKLEEKFNFSICTSTLYNWLKKLKITYKKAKKKIIVNQEQFKLKLRAFSEQIKKCVKENIQVISVDEFSLQFYMIPGYGWALKGESCEFNVKSKKSVNYSVLAAINKYKVVDYQLKEGSINKDDYKNFIYNITKNRNNVTILMDNASIHKAKVCTKMYNKNNINCIFNVPYTPELNPIEYFNNKVKCYIKKTNTSNLRELKKSLSDAINTVTRKDMINFFKKSLENNLENLCKNVFDNE